MRKLIFTVILCCLTLLVSCGSPAAATVNGEVITEAEVENEISINRKLSEYYDSSEEFPTDREGVIYRIAERMVVEQAARSVGINISDAEIRKLISNELEDISLGIDQNNENFVKRSEDDNDLLGFLGFTLEEFIEKVYFEQYKASEINSEYAVWYYGIYGFDMDAYDAHKKELMDKAEIIIFDTPEK